MNLEPQRNSDFELPFKLRALSALCISIVADALDYLGAPLFAIPIVGDIGDAIVISLLYSITKSKVSTAMNILEFIPFIGDLIPTYTISTLIWIIRESSKRRDQIIDVMPDEKAGYELSVIDRVFLAIKTKTSKQVS